jgi:hypothetical protein
LPEWKDKVREAVKEFLTKQHILTAEVARQ